MNKNGKIKNFENPLFEFEPPSDLPVDKKIAHFSIIFKYCKSD